MPYVCFMFVLINKYAIILGNSLDFLYTYVLEGFIYLKHF